MRKNSVGSVSIRADGQIWLDDRPTPYSHTRSADGASDFWRMEDPYFGTRFKRLGLKRRIYADTDEKALHADILDAMERDGFFDSTITRSVMNLVGKVTDSSAADAWLVCFDESSESTVRVSVDSGHVRDCNDLVKIGSPFYIYGDFLFEQSLEKGRLRSSYRLICPYRKAEKLEDLISVLKPVEQSEQN